MPLNFPNHSRSYDRTRQAVRFWGYDTSIEYSFFVTVDALEMVEPHLRRDEEGFLSAFDANRDLIFQTAGAVHRGVERATNWLAQISDRFAQDRVKPRFYLQRTRPSIQPGPSVPGRARRLSRDRERLATKAFCISPWRASYERLF
jgi:hypothetical protein